MVCPPRAGAGRGGRRGLVFGAKRLLAGLPADCTARQFALYQPADILETLAQNPGQDAAVLYSGATGFYSGASGLLTPLRALGIPARVYPGISSVQLLSAALGRPWQDWKLVSAHGCACDPVAECMTNKAVFFLTGGTETPAPSSSSLLMLFSQSRALPTLATRFKNNSGSTLVSVGIRRVMQCSPRRSHRVTLVAGASMLMERTWR